MALMAQYGGAVLATIKRDAMIFLSYRFRRGQPDRGNALHLGHLLLHRQAHPARRDRAARGLLRVRGRRNRHHLGAHIGAHDCDDRAHGVDGRKLRTHPHLAARTGLGGDLGRRVSDPLRDRFRGRDARRGRPRVRRPAAPRRHPCRRSGSACWEQCPWAASGCCSLADCSPSNRR